MTAKTREPKARANPFIEKYWNLKPHLPYAEILVLFG